MTTDEMESGDGEDMTMREILDSTYVMQLNRFLNEIIAGARSVSGIVENGMPSSWDADTLRRHVHTVSYYAEALQKEIDRVVGSQRRT